MSGSAASLLPYQGLVQEDLVKLKLTIGLLCVMALGLLLEACTRPLPPQPACGFVQNPELQRVSWKHNIPVKLYLHESVPTQAYDAIDRAVAEYNTNIGGGLEYFKIVARGVSGDLNPQKDGYSMIYWFTTWDVNRPTEQARTTIYWSGSDVFEADMRINAANFTFNYGTGTTFAAVDLDSLVLHELGHVLGLAHTTAPGSAMHATLDEGQVRRDLGAVDLSDLKCEY
jgi:hypothetical protein